MTVYQVIGLAVQILGVCTFVIGVMLVSGIYK